MQSSTFCERLISAANDHSDNVAMTLFAPTGAEVVTFGEMLARIRSLAYRLSLEEIQFGDRVAIIGENHPNWAIAYLGIIYRGAVVVPLDPSATPETLAKFLNDSETRLAFVSASAFEKIRSVVPLVQHSLRLIGFQASANTNGSGVFCEWVNTTRPLDFDTAAPPAKAADMAVLIYTSGTTGTPKAVPLTHGNIFAEVDGVQEVLRLTDREVILSLLPLFHAYSQIVNLWLATVIGARVVYISEVNSEEIARGLKEGRVTTLTGVPRLWYLFHKKIFDGVRAQKRPVRWLFGTLITINGWLRDSLGVNAGRLFFRAVHQGFGGNLRLAVSAGSSFDASVAQDYHRLGFTILQGYGLTETAGAATVTRFEDNKVGSVGKPLNHVEVRIDRPNDQGVGEVVIRGDIVMSGYYRNPQANSEAFTDDKWFRSGDLGYFDDDGNLFIVGRMKDVIILPSGKNVYPEDVEAHYCRSPLVSEICVLGVPDESSDFAQAEKLCGVIVPDFDYLKQQGIANAREAIRFDLDNLGRALPEYQRVRDYLVQSEALPRTATRKIRRFEVLERVKSNNLTRTQRRNADEFIFSEDDRRLLETTAGRSLASAIENHVAVASPIIHPQMNLELDLGLDSLARAECLSTVEEAMGIEIDSAVLAKALTVGDVIELANARNGENGSTNIGKGKGTGRTDWSQILSRPTDDIPEINQVLKRRPVTVLLAFILLKVCFLAARVFLRMEVRGLEHLRGLKAPFLICPNHQSFLDPILVCSVYPYSVLKNIFHVGASEYWSNVFSAQIAKLLNIVPVDPDTNLMKAMRAGAAGLRAGKILNIYPEGERSFDGLLHPFKKGAAILSTELNLPIVPVALDGVHKVWPRKSWRIRLARVRICFGDVINPAQVVTASDRDDRYQSLTDKLSENIGAQLVEMRQSG